MTVRTAVIACGTIRPELEAVMEECGCSYPAVFLDAALHDRPEDLRREIQKQLDTLTETDRVLLSFGYCGGAAAGLCTGDFEMILPKADDCITMFFGSEEVRRAVPDERYTFFLTEGWISSERNLLGEYERLRGRYGEKRADRVMSAMYRNYHAVGLVDTGLFERAPQEEKARQTADLLHLDLRIFEGTGEWLRKLLLGPYGEGFIRIGPHETVERSCFHGSL